MDSFSDLFNEMLEEKSSLPDLTAINITTSLDYQLYKDEDGQNILRLEDKLYLLPSRATLYVDQEKVYVNNRIVTTDLTVYDDEKNELVKELEKLEEDESEKNETIAIDKTKIYTLPDNLVSSHGLTIVEKRESALDDRIDKRKVLSLYQIKDEKGTVFPVRVFTYRKGRQNKGVLRYGQFEIYPSSPNPDDKYVLSMVNYLIGVYKGYSFTNPFYDNESVYILGKRRIITSDKKLKEDPLYFYVEKSSHPIGKYKKLFFLYLHHRLLEIGKIMGQDLSTWKINIGDYFSFFACNGTSGHYFKFDYRNFSYQKDILDALIIHEIAHCYIHPHNKKFYALCRKYSPDYDRLDDMLMKSAFNDTIYETIKKEKIKRGKNYA